MILKRLNNIMISAAAMLASFGSITSAATFRIEIDYMANAGHSHEPSQAVVDAVVQMFACQGHTLIIDVDDQIPHHNVLIRDPEDCDSSLFNYDGAANSFGALKDQFFDNGDGWHYCIFAHQYEDTSCNTSGSSGLAEGSGWNFIVSLGSFSNQTGTLFDQAATLAHEFGHNLGLSHCGSMLCNNATSDPNWVGPYTPNLASVMSYRYQLAGVRSNMLFNNVAHEESRFKNIDFSHGTMCSLNEDDLDEFFGSGMVQTDWNCNGTLQGSVAQDINGGNAGWCGATGNRTVLSDYNEWAVISDPGVLAGEPIEYSCITSEEWKQVQREMAIAGSGPQPALTTEACLPGENVFIAVPLSIPIGTCSFPFNSVQLAHDVAPAQSAFFFMPGTYNPAGVVTLDKPGVYMCNIGTAVMK
jgi:hypothetical protein